MVGFPGETEEQFEEIVQFIQDYPLDHMVFSSIRGKRSPLLQKCQGILPKRSS